MAKTTDKQESLIASTEKTDAPAQPGRVFSKNYTKIHDLYKLQVGNMLKNMAQDGAEPEYIKVEHCHFFHTFTSDGSAQNTSSTIGGHFHVMEVVSPAIGSSPAVYKCSPPMRWGVVKNKYGRKERKMVPANEVDEHTHDVQYIKSDELTMRKPNIEAARFQATEIAKYDKTVPGVQG